MPHRLCGSVFGRLRQSTQRTVRRSRSPALPIGILPGDSRCRGIRPCRRQRPIFFLRSPFALLFGRDHVLLLRFGLWRRRTRRRAHLARRDEFAFGFVELTCGLVVTLALHAVLVQRSRVTLRRSSVLALRVEGVLVRCWLFVGTIGVSSRIEGFGSEFEPRAFAASRYSRSQKPGRDRRGFPDCPAELLRAILVTLR
jgi:hypothetical protein